jgi:intraflagellar transport protein 88
MYTHSTHTQYGVFSSPPLLLSSSPPPIQSYEAISESKQDMPIGFPEYQSPYNLLICYYALGDSEKMKKGFTRLLSTPQPSIHGGEVDEDEDTKEEEDGKVREQDGLKEEIRLREKKAHHFVLTAAKLIAPYIDRNEWVAGFDWLIDGLRGDHATLASEMEIAKGIAYLRRKQFDKAIDVLKGFEKRDHALRAQASTNLSFLYFLEGDFQSADKYANLAVRNDRYNAKALVNKGNCLFASGELEKAKELFLEAIGVEADCMEAIFNLGLANKQLGQLNEAMQAFEKLHSIVPNSPEVRLKKWGMRYALCVMRW